MQRTRFPLALLAAALFVVLPGVVTAQTPSMDGLWTLTWETPRGEQSYQVTLEQSEGTFMGTAVTQMGEMPVKSGTIDGDKVRFVIEITRGGPGGQARTFEQVFEGVLADGVIKGEIQMPAMGGRGGGGGQGGPGGPRPFTMTRGGG